MVASRKYEFGIRFLIGAHWSPWRSGVWGARRAILQTMLYFSLSCKSEWKLWWGEKT